MKAKRVPHMSDKLREFFLKWLEENRPDFYRNKVAEMRFEDELRRDVWRKLDCEGEWEAPLSLGESWQE